MPWAWAVAWGLTAVGAALSDIYSSPSRSLVAYLGFSAAGWALAIFFTVCLSSGWAQPYPVKPINMIVGWGAGGATDVTIRALSEAAGKPLGQPIVVTNKPGGGSAVGLAMLKNEKPDGYTIGNMSAGGILSQYMRKVPYDILTDFTPIMRFADYAFGLVVRTEAPWKTFKE